MAVKLRPMRQARAQLRSTRTGSSVLVHSRALHPTAFVDFVRWCAAEPGYTVVAVEAPRATEPEAFEYVLDDLAASPGALRLIPAREGRASFLEFGDWLARRLRRPVVAHEGRVTIVPGGLYIPAGEGEGWLRFEPGGAPTPFSRRFPRPSWDCEPFAELRGLGPDAVVEPLPSGVWIRPAELSPDVLDLRRRLIADAPADPLLPNVVLGYPGSPLPSVAAVAEFWRSLPPALRPMVRLAGLGGTDEELAPFGQALADAVDEPVVLGDGVRMTEGSPGGDLELRTVLRRGVMAWTPYVGDLGYLPARSTGGVPADPMAIEHRTPIAGLREREPGVYEYGEDAVLEVTRSGLWVRPHAVPADSFRVRAEQADPAYATVVYDDTAGANAHRMRLLATEVAGRLEAGVRSVARILASTAIGAARRIEAGSTGAVPNPQPEAASGEASPYVPLAMLLESLPAEIGNAPAPARSAVDDEPTEALEAVPEVGPAPAPAAEPVLQSIDTQDEPIEYGAFQLVSSVVDLAVAAPEVPAAPAPAAVATSAQTVEPEPAPAPKPVAAPARPAAPKPAPKPVAPPAPKPVAAPVPPAAPPAKTAARVRIQPVPAAQCSVVPREGGLEKERDWLRRNLSKQYDATASSVARVLSEHPGLRAGTSASDSDVLTDLVALRLYVTGEIPGLDDAIRAAKVGPHVPLARCVAAGLRRLPSYRGPLRTRAALTDEQVRWYRGRSLVTEWSFLPALASAGLELPGSAEILIWSMSARRTGVLDPSRTDQVVFQPGTSFKVLSAEDGEGGPEIRLRELTRTEIAPDGTVQSIAALDEFAAGALDEAGKAWRREEPVERLPADQRDRYASPPGLLARPAKEGGKKP